jgi:hypothetical protein
VEYWPRSVWLRARAHVGEDFSLDCLYRDQLRTDLTRHNVEVKVQEDFKDLGRGTLGELDTNVKPG